MNLQCVITDDEPIAQEILEDYINMVPGLQLVAKCKNAMETLTVLRHSRVDILFIDIKMPEVSGLEFVRSLKNPPVIIFTTAYPNYAVDGFDLDAADYLLKPISIDRFLKAINKVFLQNNNPETVVTDKSIGHKRHFLFVKSDKGLIKLNYNDIDYIEAMENYVRIYLKDKIIVSPGTMKNIEDILPSALFIRIHRSYIVNLEKVAFVQNNIFTIGNKNLVVGKNYRKVVSEILKNYNLTK